jgi:ADP-dependent NAD(P)H-hydrate dehydratase / NAD(P)H-hydrate epimerase
LSSSGLPTLSSSQVKQVDALAAERFGVAVDWLMEAAGWQIARFVRQRAAVVCGIGNNAGDGLAAARHLDRWGRLASVSCVDAGRLKGPAARQLEALRNVGVEVGDALDLDVGDVIVDAIFGTGLSRPPEGKFAEWIEAINRSGKSVIAVDVPSGLDAETGVAYSPIVRASATITLGLPKPGLEKVGGRVMLADIGVPLDAYAAVGVNVPPDLFAHGELIPL